MIVNFLTLKVANLFSRLTDLSLYFVNGGESDEHSMDFAEFLDWLFNLL